MQYLGIFVTPGTHFYGEKFLLSEEESKDLDSRLRKTPLDTSFERGGQRFPDNLMPNNLPGGILSDFEYTSSDISLTHNNPGKWSVWYGNGSDIPKDNETKPSAHLEFSFKKAEDSGILDVTPVARVWRRIPADKTEGPSTSYAIGVDDHNGIFYDITARFISGEHGFDGKIFSKRSDYGLGQGINFAPTSAIKEVCTDLEFVARKITIQDLLELEALGKAANDAYGKTAYSKADRIAKDVQHDALKNRFDTVREHVIKRIKQERMYEQHPSMRPSR